MNDKLKSVWRDVA